MREDRIIQFLKNHPHPQPLTELAQAFGVSKRTIANDLKALNELGSDHGFRVVNIRGSGYKLEVTDQKRFDKYFNLFAESSEQVMSPQSRKVNIELLLLFTNDYVTLNQIAETLDVSTSTIKNDLVEVKQDFESMDLALISKAHYGYQVTGAEEDRRLFIIRLLRNDIAQPMFTEEYQAFNKTFDSQKLKAFLTEQIKEFQILVNDLVLDNLVQHIFLLAFRIKQHNLLKDQHEPFSADDTYSRLADQIAEYLRETEGLALTDNEKLYLSRQLFGKIVTVNDPQQHQELTATIDQVLQRIDEKYQTTFHEDRELIDALTLHVAPLLQRLYVGRQLDNPIIDDVYTRYANVFNIAFEFIDEISADAKMTISKDEAGYLAIYFAASLEKQLQNAKDHYRKIAVICATGGGASYFVKTKLEQIFANAQVETFSLIDASRIDRSYDLIITTVPLQDDFDGIPVIRTQALLTDTEINKIQQDLLLIQDNSNAELNIDQQLLSLFSADNFQLATTKDYLRILQNEGTRLEKAGWVAAGYTELVLQRENLVDTIYKQGVAGPHPMESKTLRECISIILCPEECRFHDKPVRIIFLINISNNHLFLHKEISRLMIKLMDDNSLQQRLATMENYDEFIFYIKELIKKG